METVYTWSGPTGSQISYTKMWPKCVVRCSWYNALYPKAWIYSILRPMTVWLKKRIEFGLQLVLHSMQAPRRSEHCSITPRLSTILKDCGQGKPSQQIELRALYTVRHFAWKEKYLDGKTMYWSMVWLNGWGLRKHMAEKKMVRRIFGGGARWADFSK